MGYSITFNMNGMKYLVDIKGRDMFLKSRETLFGGFVVAAISKFYPMFVGKMMLCVLCNVCRIQLDCYFFCRAF